MFQIHTDNLIFFQNTHTQNSINLLLKSLGKGTKIHSLIRYAVLEKNSKSVNYDQDQGDLEDRCSMAGVDLTDVAEKELEDRNP